MSFRKRSDALRFKQWHMNDLITLQVTLVVYFTTACNKNMLKCKKWCVGTQIEITLRFEDSLSVHVFEVI